MRFVLGPIGLVDVEEVGVLAETLTFLIALPLKRFAMDLVDAEQPGDALVNLDDQLIVGIEIAAIAGADVLVLLLVVQGRGVAALIDFLAHLPTGVRVEEIVAKVELDWLPGVGAKAPQLRRGVEIVADAAPNACAKVGPLLGERRRRLVKRRWFHVGHVPHFA